MIRCFIAFALLAMTAVSSAATSPLDFSYRTSGVAAVRPSLVFNDGEDTYIQPSGRTKIVWLKGGEAERSGPYVIVKGLPQKIELIDEHNDVAVLQYQGGNDTARSVIDLGGSYSPAGALPTIGWTGLAPAVPTRCGGVQKDESLLAVNFNPGESRLSDENESVVATAAKTRGATQVLITASENDDLDIVRERNTYLTNVLESVGIRRNAFQYARGKTIDDATEITMIRSYTLECTPGHPLVSHDGGRLTVLAAQTDATILLNEIASVMSLQFTVEGPVRFTPIDFEVAGVSHNVALHKFGAAVAAWATVILRDDELVLRFK